MSDPALDALFEHLRESTGPSLLVADEQLDCGSLLQLTLIPNLTLLTNRFDVAQCARQAGISSIFNDMDMTACPGDFQTICYRVSKEKAVVHHVINQTPSHLLPGGALVLSGFKNEGTKTYIAKTEHYLGCRAQTSKGERQLQIASFTPSGSIGEVLDDRGYRDWHVIAELNGQPLYSKPGQFGWNKIDEGSQRLADCLQQSIVGLPLPATALDLGCGYGYLALRAAALGIPQITATDNNAAAIASCRKNFIQQGVQGEVIADHCAQQITGQFDLILCNPPFHRGFDTEKSLTELFVANAARRLKSTGRALFVVNQFIPLEAVAAAHFRAIETRYRDNSFKVLELSC